MFGSFHPGNISLRAWQILALFVLALLPLSGLHAAPAPAAPAIGVIDLDALSRDYTAYKEALARMDKFTKERDGIFTALKAGLGLTLEEYKDYQDLAVQPATINKEKLEALKEKAKKNLEEYQALKQKEEKSEKLTDEETKALEQLDKNIESVSAKISEEGQRMSNEIQAEYGRYSKLLIETVDKGIETVANKMKLAIVLSKNVQSEKGMEKSVLWGGQDITADVVKHLNETFKPTMLDAPKAK